jgi:hypothetical protein
VARLAQGLGFGSAGSIVSIARLIVISGNVEKNTA